MARLTGIAARTEVAYPVGAFHETIARGAFANVNKADCLLLAEHGGMPLASTRNGSLRLGETSEGLAVDADLDESDELSRAVINRVRSGLYDSMSFSFRAAKQSWSDDHLQRRILLCDVNGGDVSVVGHAANKTTNVAVRGALTLDERRAEAKALGNRVLTEVRGLYLATDDAPDEQRRKFSAKEREKFAATGVAMASGEYPIPDRASLEDALVLAKSGHGTDMIAVRKHIIARAAALGASSLIPDAWGHDGTLREGNDKKRAADAELQTALAFASINSNREMRGASSRRVKCVICRGSGKVGSPKRTCANCKGRGTVKVRKAAVASVFANTPTAQGNADGTSDTPPVGSTRARY